MKKFFNNLLGFLGFCFSEKLVLISLMGYILILIAPMFSWYSSALSYPGISEEFSFNMFQLGVEHIKVKSFIALGIFTILSGLVLIAVEYLDYKIKLRSRLGIIKIVEMLIYIALIVIIAMALNNETLDKVMSYRSGEIEALEYWIKDAKGHCNNGIGPAIYIAGFIMIMLSKVGVYIYYFIDNVKDSLTTKKG